MSTLEHLFSAFKVRKMELANRVVMPPMGTSLGNSDSTVSEALLAYMKRQARGGAGLIITEITAVHPTGIVWGTQLGAYDDRFIPGLKKLADVIHQAGGKAALQLHHAGRESFYLLNKGEAIAPSAIPSLIFQQVPRQMTLEDIQEIIIYAKEMITGETIVYGSQKSEISTG